MDLDCETNQYRDSNDPIINRGIADRLTAANDASHYRMTPAAVATARTAEEVAAILRNATPDLPVTFRSGGTSLSGQSVTAGLLVDTRAGFRDVSVMREGRAVRVQPGAVLARVNGRLSNRRRRLGPDPASASACTVGGVIANNSSGMTCGTADNPYRTIESVTCVLPSGLILDTSAPDIDERFRVGAPRLYAGLIQIRDEIERDPGAVREIRRQFAVKNTMGYSLNAFLDFRQPADILTHLLVGSEGTLAFIAEAVLQTVPLLPSAGTGLLAFPALADATDALDAIVATGAEVIELMDHASLWATGLAPQLSGAARNHPGLTALLVEYHATDDDELRARLTRALPAILDVAPLEPPRFSAEATDRAILWKARKGLYASVAGARRSGTTALLEDIGVPRAALTETCTELAQLFAIHDYHDSVVFGHARDGNLHFMLTEDFGNRHGIARYEAFTEDLVSLVLGQKGTLKAEHGTGRVMAPFLRRQYGDALFKLMVRIKELFDPEGKLNPDVIITEDDKAHVRHLKTSPTVDAEIDRCVECGYCEPVCPSQDLTTTPRQRITLRRDIRRAEEDHDLVLAAQLRDSYAYQAVDTCAADGMCATACPVGIDTGSLMKRLRAEDHGAVSRLAAGVAANHIAILAKTGRAVIAAAERHPGAADRLSGAARRALPSFPRWTDDISATRPQSRSVGTTSDPQVVMFPSCINSVLSPAEHSVGSFKAFLRLCDRVGIAVATPDGADSLCCGTPWESKGYPKARAHLAQRVVESLWSASDHGRLPVVSDASSCTHGLVTLLDSLPPSDRSFADEMKIQDSVGFVADRVLPLLPRVEKMPSILLHPTCSSVHLGAQESLGTVSDWLADLTVIPSEWGCCGFAGDRGNLVPELTRSAVNRQLGELSSLPLNVPAVSCNRTCELGMARATGRRYRHILELLDEHVATSLS